MIKVIVLAGGEGKRMWPIHTDKYLIPFLGKPLLHHNLKKMQAAGFAEFIIITNPKSTEKISQIAKDLNLNFQIAIQNDPKGMADALLSAKELIKDEVLVVNAEDILDPLVFKQISAESADVVITGLKVKSYFPGGYLKMEGEKVAGIAEKPGEGNEPSDLLKLVADYFRDGSKLIKYLEEVSTDKDDRYERALDQMIKNGAKVHCAKYDGPWLPLKYPWHIVDITEFFLSEIDQNLYPGKVMIEEGVKVFEGAIVKGPCYIGRNCIVGSNSMIRESSLEEGCVTGFNSDIARSYIGANSWFHSNYVGDSVLEGDFGMGSGAVLANLRLDGKTIGDTGRTKLGLIASTGVRIGVNASTMPGVKIGAGSIVGPGVVLKKDLPENKKITLREESYEVKDCVSTPTAYGQFRTKLT